ncbi:MULTISPECIES: arabinose transporter [Paraburkholderia]|uniref:arabinose transporter n=1 Tax=Paraburkholderia phenoliruptrix TaxID=252970 RepID=UPI001C6E090D|nr:arabinose transporter [Paraburkholderia phenoliruptrix]MBW9105059.1 arabinose transporter [Paraburkholderia phenoliruptrix]MBW9129705.1 arabinose transporter [Paraburkholderia ginsengiterrae]
MKIPVTPPQYHSAAADRSLLPLMSCVFTVFLVTGAALPALPLHLHRDLGFGTFTVGLVSAAQFASSLASRLWCGAIADRRGPKFAVSTGLGLTATAGLLYLLSLTSSSNPSLSVAILLMGRALLGAAESFIMTGSQSWCLALAGPGNVGKSIAWIGTSMFVALAAGSPLGSFLFDAFGFASIGLATSAGSVVTMLLIRPVTDARTRSETAKAVGKVLKAVWLPGLGMAFPGLGYGIMTAFSVLLFVQRGWQPAWLSFTAFASALMVARFLFGALPDRLGGARTAAIFVTLHSAGMALIWAAAAAWLAFAGAALAGFGYALVYPGFGMEAVARAPTDTKGLAMGVYTAFIDLAFGVFAPLLGLVANVTGLRAIFLISAILALLALPIAMRLRSSAEGTRDAHLA